MRRRICVAVLGSVVLAGLVLAYDPGVPDKHPVYVGVKACAECHTDQATGHQFNLWRVSKHAQAYAALWSPEAKKIAKLSGISEEPQKAPICLGCHATAAEAETWEKEETFELEDGVQCEKCHGAGSEYSTDEIMYNREEAIKHGLKIPTEPDCMVCHLPKGSHVAVLGSPVFDVKAAWKETEHPTPKGAHSASSAPSESPTSAPAERPARVKRSKTPRPAKAGGPEATLLPSKAGGPEDASSGVAADPRVGRSSPKYAGVAACGKCHDGAMMGHQLSRWRTSPHARAYAVLATPKGYEIASQEGVPGDPQKAPDCLRCHTTGTEADGEAFLTSFDVLDGVQCEACHGPGSEYSPEAIMRDQRAAVQTGLQSVTEKTCLACHEKAHGKSFDYADAVKQIEHPTRPPAGEPKQPGEIHYKTPLNLALSPNGRELYVACEASDTVIVVDVAAPEESAALANLRGTGVSPVTENTGETPVPHARVLAEIPTGGQPTDVAFNPDGSRAYVTNRMDDSLAIIDTATHRVLQTIPVGDEPHGVLTDPSGRQIYVLNTSADSISVIDADSLTEVRRLSASRGPWSLAISPDGRRIAATNTRSRFVEFREPPLSEVTLLDAERAVVERRAEVPGANMLQGIAWHPSGEFALATLMRTKNLVPMTRVFRGGTITNGLAVLWRDGRVDQVLLDQPDVCLPDPSDVAISPDGRYAFVSSSGLDRVAVVDIEKLIGLLKRSTPYEREHVLPNHLGKPTEFIVKLIPVKDSPRGIVFSRDGRVAYVANALDDSVSVIDVAKLETVARIDLGGPKEITTVRRGERLFHSANITFQRQFSCHSCHPDGHVNGLTFDIEPDGIGILPVDNRTLRGILDTAPFKWEGTNPTLERECGPRLAAFFTRIQPFTPDELTALTSYVATIPRPPNRYRPIGTELTAAQRRGKAIFERTKTNDGRVIPDDNRCIMCHAPPYYTNRTQRNIGTQMMYDDESVFDVPHLSNIYDSAPYLHNGIADTLEQIWTTYNPYDKHGVTNDMTKDQLNDLIEYLKTL